MSSMTLKLKVVKEPRDVSDAKDGSRLLGTVEIFGASHHLELLRATEIEEEGQTFENEECREHYDDLQTLYSADKYETFEIPGLEGRYIAYMVPFED